MANGLAIGHEVYVWRVDLIDSLAKVDVLKRTLSDDERWRADRFKFARDRDQYIICKIALRQILGTILEIDPAAVEFTKGAYGKPQLVRGNLRFNLSHSGAYGLIAIARGRELGIDIEEMRTLDDALMIASRFFSPKEVQHLSALAEQAELTQAFFECWTRKEAFIKAVGEGLSYPLDTFSVTFFPDESAELHIGTQTSDRWALVNIDTVPGYCGALVFECLTDEPNPRVVHREWA